MRNRETDQNLSDLSNEQSGQKNKYTRRTFLRMGAAVSLGIPAMTLLEACGGGGGNPTPIPKETETPIPPTSTPESSPTPEKKTYLKDIASSRGILVGSQVRVECLPDRSRTCAENIAKEFNLALIGGLQWGGDFSINPKNPIRPSRDVYNFSDIDPALDFAKQNKMAVAGQHLIWGATGALPEWVLNGGYTKQELTVMAKEHIVTVMNHFREKVGNALLYWSVVNEYYSNPNGNFWFARFGEDFLPISFQTARDTDKNAKLYLNNGIGNEMLGGASNQDYERVRKLKQAELIDAYGFQMHLKAESPPDLDSIRRNIERFQKLGVEVLCTEIDLNTRNLPGTLADRDQTQAEILRPILSAYFEMGGKFTAFFGMNDSFSWLGPNARGTLYDTSSNPKPARDAVRDAILSVPNIGR